MNELTESQNTMIATAKELAKKIGYDRAQLGGLIDSIINKESNINLLETTLINATDLNDEIEKGNQMKKEKQDLYKMKEKKNNVDREIQNLESILDKLYKEIENANKEGGNQYWEEKREKRENSDKTKNGGRKRKSRRPRKTRHSKLKNSRRTRRRRRR